MRGQDHPAHDSSTFSEVGASGNPRPFIRLFQRTTRRLSLTEAGDIYLAQIEPLVDEFERARDAAASTTGTPRGLLRMTTSETIGHIRIVPLLKEFRERYPLPKLECLSSNTNLNLMADRIDLAIRLGPTVEGSLIADSGSARPQA
jgi:DNA-binding transcriptional LysR family regulator